MRYDINTKTNLSLFKKAQKRNTLLNNMSVHNADTSEREWNEMFEMLVQVQRKRKHGTNDILVCNPQRFTNIIREEQRGVEDHNSNNHDNNNSSFDLWLDAQEKFWKHHKLGSDEVLDKRYQRLASLGGFETTSNNTISRHYERWNNMYENLIGFKKKHGHTKVPEKCNENPKLGKWVSFWRSKYREYKRTNGKIGDRERMKRLEKIGLVDDISTGYEKDHAINWNNMYSILVEFKKKHGHVKVPTKYNENPKFGKWVTNWKHNYKEYRRTDGQKGDPERMERLESIGLVENTVIRHQKKRVNSRWDDMVNLALEFKKKHGHLKIPDEYNENRKLGKWVSFWRRNYRNYKRTNGQKGDPERMKRLESIGLVDDISTGNEKSRVNNSSWDSMFNLLVEFKKKHGHVKVPTKYNENPKFGKWVTNWKHNYKEYRRTDGQKGDPERMKRLESIGLVDNIFRKNEDKEKNCVNDKIFAPITVSSMSPTTFSSNIQNSTEGKKNGKSGDANTEEVDLAFLGSELRGGFWA
jgi:hypothetical protein